MDKTLPPNFYTRATTDLFFSVSQFVADSSTQGATAESSSEAMDVDTEGDVSVAASEKQTDSAEGSSGKENQQAASTVDKKDSCEVEEKECLDSLSEQLNLTPLWETLSSCLRDLADTPDHHAVLVLQVSLATTNYK